MADHFYGVDRGGQAPGDVTVAAATTSKAIELRVTDGTGITKTELIKALEVIENKIAVSDAPA